MTEQSPIAWAVYGGKSGVLRYDIREAVARMAEWRGWFVTGEAPSPSEWAVEASAQEMFEDPLYDAKYTWAEMVTEDPSRADIWRADARRVLEAAREVHP